VTNTRRSLKKQATDTKGKAEKTTQRAICEDLLIPHKYTRVLTADSDLWFEFEQQEVGLVRLFLLFRRFLVSRDQGS